MESLADLISREVSPEPGRVNSPAAHPLDAPIVAKGTDPTGVNYSSTQIFDKQ